MDDEPASNRKKRGRRRITAGLRKHQQIDGVVVEEIFPLFDSSSIEKVGDGIYVSATTTGNKRFYGVMVDQSSLKEATTLFFQDQSDSLSLNERMKTLLPKVQEHQDKQKKDGTKTSATASSVITPKIENEAETTSNETTSDQSKHDNQIGGKRNDGSALSLPVQKKARLSAEDSNDINRDDEGSKTKLKGSSLEALSLSKAPFLAEERPIQKFKYVEEDGNPDIQGGRRNGKEASKNKDNLYNNYRVLVATFNSVYEACCGDYNKAKAIHEACEEGGNFLSNCNENDSYYYQYEVIAPSLTMDAESASKLATLRTSMGFHSFLHGTALPPWYPLSNLYTHNKALTLLSKPQSESKKPKRNSGGTKTEKTKMNLSRSSEVATIAGGTKLPMHSRAKKEYRIGVIGGGIAGLACCRELITALNNDGIDAKVTLVEARSRLGGRIATDRSWKTKKNNIIPVELGASWIHGIDDNPLAALAQSAGIEFVKTSEEVKMVDVNMKEVDSKMDEKMGKLFDDLLDHATEDCWSNSQDNGKDPQTAVRWYASCFSKDDATGNKGSTGEFVDYETSMKVDTPVHRRSNDRSVDVEIGKAIARHKFREFSKLKTEEHRMLLWNTKNVEYALGSNLDNLSMKYWDVDDRHAFEGDHVLLKEGYSAVIDHMFRGLKQAGSNKFEYVLNFPVGKVEYGRKSEKRSYGRDRFGRERQLVELSDSCSITSEDGKETKYFDFLVSAVPLGVLKESVDQANNTEFKKKMTFSPPLPFCKVDAISNVGFGLLNKVYVEFPEPFWRVPGFFTDKDDCLFGNVTGINPQHYMFFDVGKRLGSEGDSPAILMSLVSGKEAVALEYLSDEDVIKEVVDTLKVMFPKSFLIPSPINYRITRWGKDRFSRGSYTYLPPGSTDQDFQMLQSPVNATGDSLLIDSRTDAMRLFFAGEHTTALHPSVTHGAMLSGVRAAQEVLSTIQSKNKIDKDVDTVIPISVFKHSNPTTALQCNLCRQTGGRTREGPLLAFKRGARQVVVHNNCAEYCPEVEVVDFKWKNVVKAVNRGRNFACRHCSQTGATMGCASSNCFRMFHFSCAEDTGWRFDRDGKVFYCDECRQTRTGINQCDRVSIKYFMKKNPRETPICNLCHMPENEMHGELLAFQKGSQMCCVHLNCIKHTTVVKPLEVEHSRMLHEYQNVFDVLEHSKNCSVCDNIGASIRCSQCGCDQVFHYHCAIKEFGWDFQRKGSKRFQCGCRQSDSKNSTRKDSAMALDDKKETDSGFTFQHDLFANFGAARKGPKVDIPGNLDISGTANSPQNHVSPKAIENSAIVDDSDENENSDDDDTFLIDDDEDGWGLEVMDFPLSPDIIGVIDLVRLERPSRKDLWNISFQVVKINNKVALTVASANGDGKDEIPIYENSISLQPKDIIVSINGSKVGSNGLSTLRGILFRLKQEVDLVLEVIRQNGDWL